jgi:SAM-dependent methyltransferase
MWQMMGGSDVRMAMRALALMEPVHRAAWLGAAVRHGVLTQLAKGPLGFDELAESLAPNRSGRPALKAWLQHGVVLKELRLGDDGYSLRGLLARRLVHHEEFSAFIEALTGLHHKGIHSVLDRLAKEETFSLRDLDAPLVARTSELLAPMLRAELDRVLPSSGPVSLLELGCGTGLYIRHACDRNPDLTAMGVDLDAVVADQALTNLEWHELGDRVRIRAGDLRTFDPGQTFDVVTLFNLLYYFRTDERASVLAEIARHVAPGGKLVVASSCLGGTLPNSMLNIWFSAMPECGPLPDPDETVAQLRAAGLEPHRIRKPLFGEAYCVFVAERARD